MADIGQPIPPDFVPHPKATAERRSSSAARATPSSLLNGADWSESGRLAELQLYCHRLRVGLAVGLVFWLLFGIYDWVVVTWIEPGSLVALTGPRLAGALCIGLVLARATWLPIHSIRTVYRLATTVLVAGAGVLALTCIHYRGFASPYAHGISLLIVGEAMLIPKYWTRGLLHTILTASMFLLVLSCAAFYVPAMAAQLTDPSALAELAGSISFIVATSLFAVIGAHVSWALRRQVFASRSVGRYRLNKKIDAGGAGEIWLAWHEGLQQDVAIKIVRAIPGACSLAITRFEREISLLTQLQHPNIVRLYDFGHTVDGLWYYVMELLDGRNLADLIKRNGALSPAVAVGLVRQAAGALAEAHAKNVVHRDVKPENLFATALADGQICIKVLDFGIARTIQPDLESSVTNEGWIGGTPDFISPEAARGDQAGPPADVYGLGGVLYFLLTASPPFGKQPPLAALHAHIHKEPMAPSERIGAPLPAELEQTVLRCLAKNPEDRPSSARELARSLDDLGYLPASHEDQRCLSLLHDSTEVPADPG